MLRLILFILFILMQAVAAGQQRLQPQGYFSTDTVLLGKPVQYTLVLRHAARQEVVLPDANYNFAPFEFVGKRYFPTTTKGNISIDSVIYTVRTFETYPIQQLALPVYVLQGSDTLAVFAPADAVVLKQLVKQVKEPLTFKQETELLTVAERFDWPVLLVWLVAGLVFLSLVWFIFGQTIRVKYKLYKLRKDHVYFSSRYSSHVDRFVKSGASQSIEKAVTLWKNYLTKLERKTINSYTTKEIVEFYNDNEEVSTALRLCDKAIYGNVLNEPDTETSSALHMLRQFARSRYQLRREITKNAKNKR